MPYLVAFIVALMAGQFADFLRYRGILGTGKVRKLMTGIGKSFFNFDLLAKQSIVQVTKEFNLACQSEVSQ